MSNVFNPKILDASIRDVASCLSDDQKADLLLYAIGNLPCDGPSKAVSENALLSCLQISTLSPTNTVKARILRARWRIAAGYLHGAQDDLQAALAIEPGNSEANTLLHHRSETGEKILCPTTRRSACLFSDEIWREIALCLPRRDLKPLLFVPNALSRIASQLLFRKLDLHLSVSPDNDDNWGPGATTREHTSRFAQRSADILTRIIVDATFGSFVRTLCIFSYAVAKDDSMAFQIGMLANALPRLINLRNVYISALSENTTPLLRLLQGSPIRLRGLSLVCPDAPVDLSHFECNSLHHMSYSTREGNPAATDSFIAQNRSLRTISLHNMSWTFPVDSLALRNLTSITFSGHFPANSQAFADILTHARQLESLSLTCTLDCLPAAQFRSAVSNSSLHFLRHFTLVICGASRRPGSTDFFPAVSEFLRAHTSLRTLALTVREESDQRTVGFDAAVWGVLPALIGLRSLAITYPKDLAPGLAAWLIPRSVRALTLDYISVARDYMPFLSQIRPGIPPGLRYVALSDFPVRNVAGVVEHGFPMVRVVRLGKHYWKVTRNEDGSSIEVCQWTRGLGGSVKEWLEWMGCEDSVLGRELEDVPF